MKISKNFDFLKFFKPCLIVSFVLVVLSSILFGFFGFNKSFDFTGGTQLVVNFEFGGYNIESEKDVNIASEKVYKILNDNHVNVNSFQVQGEFNQKSFIITFKEKNSDVVENIRKQINEQLNLRETYDGVLDSAWDMTKQTSVIESFVSKNLTLTTVSALLFALVVVMIYSLIRLKVASSLALVFGGIFDVVLTLAFVLIARIEINTYFVVALGVTLVSSIFGSADLFYGIKEKLKNPLLTDKTNYEIANIVLHEKFQKFFVLYIFSLILTAVIGLIGVLNIFKLALALVVGLSVSFASLLFVKPAFWQAINKKREISKPASIYNNEDKNAEVVEIEEK